ncbi:Phytochrome kinase substrate 1-like [Thalictrum thalictroides]|uniref:Phytochrome kinase substrate 1-like n=1 Tax=Thalictrum thalictroides TaxID=46969 RepID=A0A7J6VG09_THATH|nr:Phytochrome kinase substrate 1-like [Thalictrum thalictroides]
MATVTLTSASNPSISQSLGYENNSTHLRDASFSSYLSSNEETFVLKLTESIVKPSGNINTPQKTMYQASLGKKKSEYGEIGIFGAEKYFNGAMDEEETKIVNRNEKKHQTVKDGRVGMHGTKPRTKLGTPSTCSEASWNSRSALLPNAQGREDRAKGKSFLATLGCKCYCSDKDSVDVDENVSDNKSSKISDDCGEIYGRVPAKSPTEIKQAPIGVTRTKQTLPLSWLKEETPFANSDRRGSGHMSIEGQFKSLEDEKARKSLEVFGSPILDKDDITLNLEKKLSMLTWDANPRAENTPVALSVKGGSNDDTDKEGIASNLEKKVAMLTWDANPRVKTTLVAPAVRSELNDDVDSDSSSDLFEIKSLSSNGHAFFRRQASDGMSSCMSPSSCYEPSEASIDWSVVTASAANFSVATDYDEPNPATTVHNHENRKTTANITPSIAKTDMSKGGAKRRPSMLLGCRSHKAVKVVGGAHKVPEKKPELRKIPKSNSFTPRSRFQTESKVTDFESAHAQRAFAKGTSPQLHSPRAVEPLYLA